MPKFAIVETKTVDGVTTAGRIVAPFENKFEAEQWFRWRGFVPFPYNAGPDEVWEVWLEGYADVEAGDLPDEALLEDWCFWEVREIEFPG